MRTPDGQQPRALAEALSATPHLAVPILVIDDTPAKRLAMRAVLAPLGYRVVEADSGAAGLRCVMAENFAVILLDVRMPGLDGFETAALIRLRRQSEMTPIIFVTAIEFSDVVADRYAQGAVDFITTPVRPEELRAKVSVFAHLFQQAEAIAVKARDVQRSADQLRLLTESAPIGIFQTDAHNRYVYTNRRWSQITGRSGAASTGHRWHSIISDADRPAIDAAFDASPHGAEFSTRVTLDVHGAGPRIVLLTSKPLLDEDGGTTGWVGTLADVTAEAEAEAAMTAARDQATAASKLKSDFLANMSHEIRTPMNGVIGLTELLLDTDLDEEQRDFVQTLSHSGDALMTVIDEILDFSKIESGKLEVERIQFSLENTVRDVVALMTPAARTQGLELVAVAGDTSVPEVVTGDPSRLRQVLTNLIGNAVKFTPSGRVAVSVSAEDADDSSVLLRFEVSDTGVGIPRDKQELVFEPFTQADTSTTREYGGTGLGLAISSQLVALMGGEMGLVSEVGVGSTFWFTVSVERLPDEVDQDGRGRTELTGTEVLVVEPVTAQRALLRDHLTAWGVHVTTAATATAAIAALRDAADGGRPVDVALVDESVHRREGATLAAAIARDGTSRTRLVLMGAQPHLTAADPSEVVLTRPVERSQLRACLHRALAARAPVSGTPAALAASGPGARGSRLLLAEDNLINQTVASAILTGAGYVVDTVNNGAEAVRAATAHPYDVILMDCHMPQLNGYEATAAIRSHEGPDRHTPVIALTAGARAEDREQCLAAGMDAHVSKPIRAAQLLQAIREVLVAG